MDGLLQSIRKMFGEDAIFLLGEKGYLDIKVRSSGSLLLDIALGGGYPQGRVIEISGREKAGKTTLLNLAIAEAQKNESGKKNAIIDLEYSYNPKWAKTLGVDIDKLYISQPDTYAERVYQMIEFMLKTKEFAIIGIDSVAGLIPKEEYESEDWEKDSRIGGASRINSKAIRKLVNSGLLSESGTTLILINQLRDKIGTFSPYGTPTDTPGGRSLKHAYSQQLEVSIGDYFQKGTGAGREIIGQQIKIRVVKNKIAPPFRTATVDVYYDSGVDRLTELINVAKEIGVLEGTSWLRLVDPTTGEVFEDLKWQGKERVKEALLADPSLHNTVYQLVQKVLRGQPLTT